MSHQLHRHFDACSVSLPWRISLVVSHSSPKDPYMGLNVFPGPSIPPDGRSSRSHEPLQIACLAWSISHCLIFDHLRAISLCHRSYVLPCPAATASDLYASGPFIGRQRLNYRNLATDAGIPTSVNFALRDCNLNDITGGLLLDRAVSCACKWARIQLVLQGVGRSGLNIRGFQESKMAFSKTRLQFSSL